MVTGRRFSEEEPPSASSPNASNGVITESPRCELESNMNLQRRSKGWQIDSSDRARASRLWDHDDGAVLQHQAPDLLGNSSNRRVLTPEIRVQRWKSSIFQRSDQTQGLSHADSRQNQPIRPSFRNQSPSLPKNSVAQGVLM